MLNCFEEPLSCICVLYPFYTMKIRLIYLHSQSNNMYADDIQKYLPSKLLVRYILSSVYLR